MKTKVLIPGSSLSKTAEKDTCPACEVNIEWLIHRPHVILWADEILIEQDDLRAIDKGIIKNDDVKNESVKLVFKELKKEGILKTFDAKSILPNFLDGAIESQVNLDEQQWKKFEPKVDKKTGKKDYLNICINGIDICRPRLSRIYYSLAYSRILDSECLFDGFEYVLCKKRFGEILEQYKTFNINPFQTAFDILSPNVQLVGNYLIHNECHSCTNLEKCKTECYKKTEEYLSRVLELRDRDELSELKRIILESKTKIREIGDSLEPQIIYNEIQKQANKNKKYLLKTFPKIKRWANITTSISLPISFASYISGQGAISLAGIALAGISQGSKEIVECLTSKYQWVTFLDELKTFK